MRSKLFGLSNLRTLVAILAIVPLLGLLVVSGILLNKQVETYLGSTATVEIVDDATRLTQLVHRLRVERGQSAGFIASGGVNFADSLPARRLETDEALAALPERYGDVRQQLAELETMRANVDQVALSVPEMAGFYTGNINALLDLANEGLRRSEDPEILTLAAAWSTLARAKEAAGLQRAAGATGLGAGEFSQGVYNRFISLGAVEAQLLSETLSVLGSTDLAPDWAAGLEMSGVGEFREVITSGGAGARITDFTGPEWFAASTNWIDVLRDVEIEIAVAAEDIASRNLTSSIIGISVALLGSAFALAISLGMGRDLSNVFSSGMQGLLNAMTRLRAKEFDMRPRERDETTDIGRLFAAIDDTRQEMYQFEMSSKKFEEARKAEDEIRLHVLSEMEAALNALAEGDLTRTINEEFPGGYDKMRASYNSALAQLDSVVGGLDRSVDDLDASSKQLGRATETMNDRVNQQS